ncbi:hypothetical protein [Burkholderia sp. Ac-20365]|uniref:hypothetical protein n=1 Tax=Burkholderia sp. Ac-20365 TaxID=2703897 RepID=UPI00197B8046|nr:hypothetical protein [Burkholderia sp. Ac-20365]MBN3761195.1 hypothetical protein [Burkholderia sp. Ac-20365]
MTDTNEMRNRPRCQPIASLATRKRLYWREVRDVLGILAFTGLVAAGLCIAAVHFLDVPWLNAALLCAAIMGPPVWMFWPASPSKDDIERDQQLRRSAGMPDDVEPD